MTSKIEFYREVLADDPNSRVFFPLAKMLFEQGELDECVAVLKKSIGLHPAHLEARFLLIEALTRLGRASEASTDFEPVSSLLSNYPSVWTLWAASAKGLSRDSAVALRFLALSMAGGDLSWLNVLEQGLSAASGASQATGTTGGPGVMPGKPEAAPSSARISSTDEDLPGEGGAASAGEGFTLRGADEVMAIAQEIEAGERRVPADQLPPECGSASRAEVKTRTMADLLARHGDYSSSLEIYGELLRLASSPQEKQALASRIKEIETQMASGAAPARQQAAREPKSKAKLVSMLEALANRLDARATA